MKNLWIIFKREMMSYFFSPIAYITGVCASLVLGGSFFFITYIVSQEPSAGDFSPFQWFFNWMIFWLFLLVIAPVITMRLFADEKRTGTLETLMTAPLQDWEYVLAKFFSGLAFYLILWLPTLLYLFVLRHVSKDPIPVDWGAFLGGYLGVLLIGMFLISMGCVASACTRNQIIAAILAFAMCCAAFFGGLAFYLNAADKYRVFFEYFSMLQHMQELSRGILEWKRVVFYLTTTFFFLFLTHRIVQARQWKS